MPAIFLNADHELRSGWKLAAYIAVFLMIWLATAVAISAVDARMDRGKDELTLLAFNALTFFIPASMAMLLMARFVDRRPVTAFGVGLPDRWRRDFLTGLAISGSMLAVLLAASAALGHLEMRWTAGSASSGRLALTLALIAVAAANEELVFRGFPLQVLMQGLGTWPAILIVSGIFGLIHMGNPNAALLGGLNTVFAGIMLSVAYLRTRWLWLPYGIHIGWNAGLGFIFGFPLSGIDIPSLWTSSAEGSELVLGGGYGPEGGLLGTFIFAASAITVYKGYFK